MTKQEFEMSRRRFLAEKGDYFAIIDKSQPDSDSGASQRFADELARSRVDKANVRGLESLAWSTDSVADILDYIRMRVGRDNRNDGWAKNQIGVKLANELEGLRAMAEKFIKDNQIKDEDAGRRLHLDLCREFIKHLTAHFEFHKSGVLLNET